MEMIDPTTVNGMTDEIRKAMGTYCGLLFTLMAHRLKPFIHEAARQELMGWRRPLGDVNDPKVLTCENISERLDVSSHPMFVEEIQTWVNTLRFICSYPVETVGDIEAFGVRLIDQFCHEEFLTLCVWLETQEKGSGLTLYLGPLKAGINVPR